jgi:riboflavin kinase/FMN adenylyltransferase
MRIHEGLEHYQPPPGGTVLTIGNFDGVHLGHRRLIDAARGRARERGAPVVVVTFEPHPVAVLRPPGAFACLTTGAEKLALLEACGVDATIVVRSRRELFDQSAEGFLRELVAWCRPCAIVEGPTFSFGRGRAGSVDTLRDWSRRLEFELTVVDELRSGERADGPAINSSAIRGAVRQGRIDRANRMLGRPYRIAGAVTAGRRRGAALGFPTANLDGIPHLLPAEAVYAGVAQLAGGALHLAAINVGPQPTFAQERPCVEAHLLDYCGQLRGQRVGLHLLARLRGQVCFSDAVQLAAQLRRDVVQVRARAESLERMRAGRRVPL